MTLKHRIIPILLWDGYHCVKPVSFERPYRKLGPIEDYINTMERRNIDELIIIDIEATPQGREPNYEKLRNITRNLFCPITVGGGIGSLDHISLLLANGADKVAIQSNIKIIPKAVNKFGAQAITGVVINNGNFYGNILQVTKFYEELGVGEILLIDKQKDGVLEGYNLKLYSYVAPCVKVPVIACGGCGEPEHMVEAIKAGASAVAAGSMFLYLHHTPKDCARALDREGIPVRV